MTLSNEEQERIGTYGPAYLGPYDWGTDPLAQDVIDALRLVLLGQKDPAKVTALVNCLLEYAPETESDRGTQLVMRLVAENALKVELT